MDDDFDCYNDPDMFADDWERFEERQLDLDAAAERNAEFCEDCEYHEDCDYQCEDDHVGGEDSYLDASWEDQFEI